MSLSGLSKGAKVKLSCPACHVRQTLTAKGKKLSLRKLRGKLLPRGKSLTITATKAGAIGQQLVIKLKSYGHTKHDRDRVASNPFRVSQRCIPVGKTKPAKTCPAAPGS
jgi:hypothetical protein